MSEQKADLKKEEEKKSEEDKDSEMVNAESDKKDEIKDPFSFIHNDFITVVKPNAIDERNQIFGHLDQLKNDLKSHKQKILKQ